MRSNDIIFGLCNDVFTFSLFQQLMLNELNYRGAKVGLGTYNHHAGSLHLYERHYKMADKILSETTVQPVEKFVLSNKINEWKDLSGFSMPTEDLPKEEIKDFTNSCKSEIYA